jgi:predicted XRE-type DNA-binding protein
MMSLTEYLAQSGTSQKTFAEQVGVDQSVVSRLARRDIRPSLELAFKIERATDGQVPAAGWVDGQTQEAQA